MDGFNDRVGKVFDCLSSNTTKGAAWSLSDAQIQRQTWNRDKGNKSSSDIIINNNNKDDDATLVSSSFDNLFKPNKSNNKKSRTNNTFDDPDDEFEDDDDDEACDDKIDDLDIRSSIGLDPTLDFEEEEDEYDKIAAGTEDAGGPLLYMKDVTHHAPFLNSHNILQHHTHTNNNNNDDQPMFNAPPQPLVDHALKVKSILKRKREDLEKPSPKRVRFDPTCKEHDAPQLDGVPVPQVSKNRPGVPDYLVNPSKYTRYTFNEDDDDKRSNTEAYTEFLEQIKKSKDVGLEQKPSAADLSASMVFIPRKKRGDAAPSTSDGQVKESSTGVGITIAAVEVQQDEVSDMLQDEPDVDAVCAKPSKFQKPSRQYRSKIEDDDSVS